MNDDYTPRVLAHMVEGLVTIGEHYGIEDLDGFRDEALIILRADIVALRRRIRSAEEHARRLKLRLEQRPEV